MVKKIYKYCKIDEFLFHSLVNNELFFANPRDFNDPFDSKAIFSLSKSKDLIEMLFNHVKVEIVDKYGIVKSLPDFQKRQKYWEFVIETFLNVLKDFGNLYDNNSKSKEEKLIEMFTFYSYPEIFNKVYAIHPNEFQRKLFEDLTFLLVDFNGYGITCGSTTNNCSVMWGHYAQNHQGVCLEFEISDSKGKENIAVNSEDIFSINSVNYTNTPINMFILDDLYSNSIQSQLLSTKSKTWAYENEVRIISNSQGVHKFRKSQLKSIIFGAKSTPKNRLTLIRILAAAGYKASLQIASMQIDNYDMKIESMTNNDLVGANITPEELKFKPNVP